MTGESEFVFSHALAREVAYSQPPRSARAHKHAALAAWLERKAGGRREERADIMAYHYAIAFDSATAAGEVSCCLFLQRRDSVRVRQATHGVWTLRSAFVSTRVSGSAYGEGPPFASCSASHARSASSAASCTVLVPRLTIVPQLGHLIVRSRLAWCTDVVISSQHDGQLISTSAS